jgi:murein L,D-transpeptidase YcbB/YkuD
MYAYPFVGKALLAGVAALSIASCGSNDASSSAQAQADVQPEQVDPQALRAAVDDEEVRRFYEAVGWKAVWNRGRGRELTQAIGQAKAHGLSEGDFLDGSPAGEPAQREARLTKAALGYASALAKGFTDPAEIREIYTVARPDTDIVAGLARAVSSDKVSDWFGSLPPQTQEYQALSREFLRYLRQAQQDNASEIEANGEPIKEGDADPRVPRLVEALASNGYLDPRQLQQPNRQTYTAKVSRAVARMQDDYGIASDGVVGPDTLEVLNTGSKERARQLAINLERLRWLERNPPPTRIDVNTAATFLDYYRDGQHRDHRRVVVGEPGWETPALGSPMYRLVANPTWTVPKSIEEDELADKGASYFRRNNMERRDGWIVQLPGPDNALGEVKFDMQNEHAIYLHDTPHKSLFRENERHRSHGCVRVEDALGFARKIAEQDGILPKFQQAMATGEETFVTLNSKIPVRLLYQTAFFRDGKVQFRTDAYGWDEDLARALGRETRERRTSQAHERGRDIGP